MVSVGVGQVRNNNLQGQGSDDIRGEQETRQIMPTILGLSPYLHYKFTTIGDIPSNTFKLQNNVVRSSVLIAGMTGRDYIAHVTHESDHEINVFRNSHLR